MIKLIKHTIFLAILLVTLPFRVIVTIVLALIAFPLIIYHWIYFDEDILNIIILEYVCFFWLDVIEYVQKHRNREGL